MAFAVAAIAAAASSVHPLGLSISASGVVPTRGGFFLVVVVVVVVGRRVARDSNSLGADANILGLLLWLLVVLVVALRRDVGLGVEDTSQDWWKVQEAAVEEEEEEEVAAEVMSKVDLRVQSGTCQREEVRRERWFVQVVQSRFLVAGESKWELGGLSPS